MNGYEEVWGIGSPIAPAKFSCTINPCFVAAADVILEAKRVDLRALSEPKIRLKQEKAVVNGNAAKEKGDR